MTAHIRHLCSLHLGQLGSQPLNLGFQIGHNGCGWCLTRRDNLLLEALEACFGQRDFAQIVLLLIHGGPAKQLEPIGIFSSATSIRFLALVMNSFVTSIWRATGISSACFCALAKGNLQCTFSLPRPHPRENSMLPATVTLWWMPRIWPAPASSSRARQWLRLDAPQAWAFKPSSHHSQSCAAANLGQCGTGCDLEPMATARSWADDHAQFAPIPEVLLTIPCCRANQITQNSCPAQAIWTRNDLTWVSGTIQCCFQPPCLLSLNWAWVRSLSNSATPKSALVEHNLCRRFFNSQRRNTHPHHHEHLKVESTAATGPSIASSISCLPASHPQRCLLDSVWDEILAQAFLRRLVACIGAWHPLK